MSRLHRCLLLACSLLILSSCGTPFVKELQRPLTHVPILGTLLDPEKLTSETRAHLKEEGLTRVYKRDPDEAIAVLWSRLSGDAVSTRRLALVELCLGTGDTVGDFEPQRGAAYHLAAAELAYAGAIRSTNGTDEVRQEYVAAYNHSTGRVAQFLFDAGHRWEQPIELAVAGRTYRVVARTSGDGRIDPRFFDDLTPANYLKFESIDLPRIRRDGIGAAMVGHRSATSERKAANPFLPPVGMSLPVNATLEFSRGNGNVELAFYDLIRTDHAGLAGQSRALAADLTAPLALLRNFQAHRHIGWLAMMRPVNYLSHTGLYQFEPYRRDRVPVVFVHGLMSDPGTWMTALNQLRADPVLREHYQLMAFSYPTGFPITHNASALRKSLREFQQFYDPNRSNPNMRRMVLVGHSMGGVISNAQIRNSGDTFTSKMFDRPIDQLGNVSEERKAYAKELLVYEANPDVERVVFMAAPFRGSNLAMGLIGAIGVKLIKLPFELLDFTSAVTIQGLTPLGYQIVSERPDSIRGLKPDSPGLATILEQPIRKGVTYHTIIGNHKMTEPLSESSDTWVPYWSAHLDGAASEAVFDAKHTTITDDPAAIEEIRRILYLHAGLPYKAPQR